MDINELKNRLKHHELHQGQINAINDLRAGAFIFGQMISELTSAGREQALAFTALEETLMWANKAIARGGVNGQQSTVLGD